MGTNPLRPPVPSPKLGVIIGVPSVGWQSTLFLKSIVTMVMPLNTVITYKFIGTRRYGNQVRPVAEADNVLVHEALAEGAQYLFSLEEDVIVPPLALRQLQATLGRNPDATVAAGIVTSKTIPPEPLIYREDGLGAYWNFRQGEVFDVGGVHMGCTLIRLADLAQIETEMVEVEDYPKPGAKTLMREYFRTMSEPDPDGKTRQSQDLFFCQLLRQNRRRILADAGVQCGHFDVENGLLYGMPAGGPPRETASQAVNLGCGLDWDFIDGIRPLRVDLHEANKPDFRADLRALPPDWTGRFAIAFSSHVLEHFDRYELPRVFAEIVRVCQPGGEIRLVLPSLDWATEQLAAGKLDGDVIDVVWGGRSTPAAGPYPEMYHKMGISRQLMAGLARKHHLAGRSQRTGYSETYRLFKPPVRPDVLAWLKEQGDFTRRFVDVPESLAPPTGDAGATPPTGDAGDAPPTGDAGGAPPTEDRERGDRERGETRESMSREEET